MKMISEEVLNLFYMEFDFPNLHLDEETLQQFQSVLARYLQHMTDSETIGGRTMEYLQNQLHKYLHLFYCFGFDNDEMLYIFMRMPSILNVVDDCYSKLLILALIEPEPNGKVRKAKILSNPNDLRISIHTLYSRYLMIEKTRYSKYNWNNLVHMSRSEFAKLFVKDKYVKPYQMFSSIDEVEDTLADFEKQDIDLEPFKKMAANEEFVKRYENRDKTL